jgi:hypothetical protein
MAQPPVLQLSTHVSGSIAHALPRAALPCHAHHCMRIVHPSICSPLSKA